MTMRGPAVAALALLSFSGSIVALHADPSSQARKVFLLLYAKQDAAIARRDLNGFLSPYASSWTYVVKKQVEATKAVWRQSWKFNFQTMAEFAVPMTQATTIQQVTSNGNQAVVIADRRLTVHYDAPTARPPRSTEPWITQEIDRDVWQKTAGGWMVARTERLSIHTIKKIKIKKGKRDIVGKTVP